MIQITLLEHFDVSGPSLLFSIPFYVHFFVFSDFPKNIFFGT